LIELGLLKVLIPFSAITAKKIKTKRLRLIIGITIIVLSPFSLYKTIFK